MIIARIKQATAKGYIEMKVGGVFDATYPNSKTRRGRVQEGGTICPTITANSMEIYRIEVSEEMSKYRIRKLTPKECWRLMGFPDEAFKKAEAVNSNSQLYKEAGNSIVVDCLVHILKNLKLEVDHE